MTTDRIASCPPRRVLLLGATGTIGRATARALLRRGHDVVFFAAVGPIDPALTAAGVHVVSDVLSKPVAVTLGLSCNCVLLHASIVSGKLLMVTHWLLLL